MESVSDVGGLPEERVAKDVTSEQLRGLAAARYVRAWAIIGGLGNVWLMGTDVRRWGGQLPGNISDVNICSMARIVKLHVYFATFEDKNVNVNGGHTVSTDEIKPKLKRKLANFLLFAQSFIGL